MHFPSGARPQFFVGFRSVSRAHSVFAGNASFFELQCHAIFTWQRRGEENCGKTGRKNRGMQSINIDKWPII
jgi:hypothetical protein